MNKDSLLEIIELHEKYTDDKEFRNAMLDKAKGWSEENVKSSAQEQETTQSLSQMAKEHRVIK